MTQLLDRPRAQTPTARRRRLPVQAWIVLGLVVVALLGWVVGFSPLLGVRGVDVSGEARLSAAQVRAAAAVRSGTPLVRLDTAAVRDRVLALPDVADAQVQVSYPSSVVITVHERVPVGVTQLGEHLFAMVDATGRQFRRLSARPPHLPLLVLPATAQATTATLRAMALVGHDLPAALRSKVTSISATGPDAVTLLMTNGWHVFWGDATRGADKARVLPGLLARGGTFYDVSNPDLVYAH